MAESFSVGEVAIIQNARFYLEYNGHEAEVTRGPGLLAMRDQLTGERADRFGYYVRHHDGMEAFVYPDQLRKRRPPQDWVKLCHLTDLPREVTCA